MVSEYSLFNLGGFKKEVGAKPSVMVILDTHPATVFSGVEDLLLDLNPFKFNIDWHEYSRS